MTEPEQKAERRASVDDVLARLPRVAIAYKTVPGNTADFYALQVLANILGRRRQLAPNQSWCARRKWSPAASSLRKRLAA